MALTFPGQYNAYVPSHKATAGLMTGFSRNPDSFPINKYSQILPVDKQLGLYATWNSRQGARIRSSNLSQAEWPDGADAPTGNDNLESFAYKEYRTQRYAWAFTMGDIVVKDADWNVLKAHADMAAMQAMTAREVLAYGVWGNNLLWGSHCANVEGAVLDGGPGGTPGGNVAFNGAGVNWTDGTEANPIILNNLNRARQFIDRDTLGVIQPKDVIIITNPFTASGMAESAEIHSYLARSPYALAQVKGDKPGQNAQWGMPDMLYGSEFMVDNTGLVAAEKPNSTVNYMIANGDVLIAVRQGGLEGIGGGPAHATIMIFIHNDDLTVESKHDPDNRLTRGRVVSDFTVQISTNSSGFYFKRAV